MDPLNLHGTTQGVEIATGVLITGGWQGMVRLTDGQEIGPVTVCQPPRMRTGSAGIPVHAHQVAPDPPKAGARVLVFVLADETIGVLM